MRGAINGYRLLAAVVMIIYGSAANCSNDSYRWVDTPNLTFQESRKQQSGLITG
jgi:hypothetical protein